MKSWAAKERTARLRGRGTGLACLIFARAGGQSSPRQPRISILGTVLFLTTLTLALPPRPATAGAYTYGAGPQRTVNAGILLLDESGPKPDPTSLGPDNPDPYIFHVLNQRTDIKPYGWTIVNPLAPKAVTTAVQSRWDNRTGQTGSNHAYPLGATVAPNMAAYWEVPLTTTASTDLAQYDILFLNLIRPIALTAVDTEKLRRFVDGGGTLWVENSGPVGGTSGGNLGNSTNTPYGPLFFQLRFSSGGSTANSATFSPVARNPIITTPYQLSELELSNLGDKHIGDYYSTADATNAAPGPGFTTVVGNSGHKDANGIPLPVIAVQQFGAGQVIVTCTGSANTINEYVGGTQSDTNIGFGTNSGPYCGTNYPLAPTQDLKLLTDIISAADSHPAERQNSHQTGSAVNALSSPVRTWNNIYSPAPAGGTPVPGAVISGHIAYVTGADGNLTAYDIYPSEDLDGDGNPDDGGNDQGAPYDILWTAKVGPNASAPTLGVNPANGHTVLFVENAKGTVLGFDTSLTPFTSIPAGVTTLTPSGSTGNFSSIAPAPTFYGGRIYAGEPDGSLFVYDFNAGASASSGVDYQPSTPTSGEYATASPTVGLVPADDNGSVNGSDIVALLPTNKYVYSIYLGARGELLGGTTGTFSTKLGKLTGAQIDAGAVPAYRTYTLGTGINNSGLPIPESLTPSGGPPATNFSGTLNGTPPVYADYDSSFGSTSAPTAAQSLTRTLIGITAQQNYTGTAVIAPISAPALDGKGNAYYTSDSSLFSYRDTPNMGTIRLNWCFQLPKVALVDADGTMYPNLSGYNFVGAPVADDQGFVYAMATNNSSTVVLCFSAATTVSADLFAAGTEAPVNSVQLTQPDPTSAAVDLFGAAGPPPINGNQTTIGGTGHIDFRSFGVAMTAQGSTTNAIYPNLAEPYPVSVTYNLGDINNTDPTVPVTQQSSTVPLHTNLVWYTVLGVTANGSGFTKVGNRLLFVDTNGSLDSVIADPQAEGIAITLKQVPASVFTQLGNANVGNAAGVPCASNGALIVSGSGGVSAYTNQVTLVVDSNRILEMNSSGDAQWAVDSTYEQALVGGTSSVYTAGSGAGGTGQVGTTSVDFNRPTSLTELTQNDYLVADTGNNRCVRFDRAGKVVWELTKFTDPNHLLNPGEPDTLNQPTSVQIYTVQDKDSQGNVLDTRVRYLISDTGNFRIVEVDDVYGATGTNQLHVLTWVSHTQDAQNVVVVGGVSHTQNGQNRQYRYQSAAYYYSPSGSTYIVSLVTNTRVAQPSATAPGAANADTGGGSVVLLNYDTSATPPATNGQIAYTLSDFYAELNTDGTFNLPKALSDASAGTVSTTATLLHLRNPRYLKVYTPQGTNTAARDYLIADDNGVYDLTPATVKDAKGNPVNVFLAQWGFTPNDYKNVTTPIDNAGYIAQAKYSRALIPFIPASIQREGTDTVGGYTVGRYLITNSFSQGEATNNTGTATPGFGGEVLELNVVDTTGSGAYATREVHDNGAGVFSGHTTSRPSATNNTSPLSQPTFAYRLQ